MFNTLVGNAFNWELSSPRELATASPVGKPWKKLGTPDAIHEGRPEPRSETMLLVPDSTSLNMFRATMGEGFRSTGEGVMAGSCGATFVAKAVGAGEAEVIERREACTKACTRMDLIVSKYVRSKRVQF
jgi:hypothetical protein